MNTTRLAAIAAFGQVAFVCAWVVAGLLEPGYSVSEQTVSELAAGDAAHPWILWVGFAVLSVGDAAAGVLSLRLLGARGRVAAGLFFAAAVGVIGIAVLPLDCATNGDPACAVGSVSWRHSLHSPVASVTHLLLTATPFAFAWGLRPRRVWLAALAAGLVGVATVIVFVAEEAGSGTYGLSQRATFVFVHLWIVVLAAVAASSAMRRPR